MSLDIYLTKTETLDVDKFTANITGNLIPMAKEAGIFECLWEPEENNFYSANQIIEPLEKGIELMKSNPQKFKKLNSPNGWGNYYYFLPWLERLLVACKNYPDAQIRVCR